MIGIHAEAAGKRAVLMHILAMSAEDWNTFIDLTSKTNDANRTLRTMGLTPSFLKHLQAANIIEPAQSPIGHADDCQFDTETGQLFYAGKLVNGGDHVKVTRLTHMLAVQAAHLLNEIQKNEVLPMLKSISPTHGVSVDRRLNIAHGLCSHSLVLMLMLQSLEILARQHTRGALLPFRIQPSTPEQPSILSVDSTRLDPNKRAAQYLELMSGILAQLGVQVEI